MTLNLLALAASTRTESLNKRLVGIAASMAEEAGAGVTTLDYATCDAPLYNGEGNVLPKGARTLADAIRAMDGLLLATPEYNWSMPGSLKNLIDWLSMDASAPLRNFPILLMCASPSVRGGISGLQQLVVPLAHLGAVVYPHVIGIGEANRQLGERTLANERDHAYLSNCVYDFVRMVAALKGE